MKTIPLPIEKHVLICTNEKANDKPCCQKVGGQEFFMKFKMRVKEQGLYNRIQVTRTGCLGYCNNVGPTMVIHEKNKSVKCYNEILPEEHEKIWNDIIS